MRNFTIFNFVTIYSLVFGPNSHPVFNPLPAMNTIQLCSLSFSNQSWLEKLTVEKRVPLCSHRTKMTITQPEDVFSCFKSSSDGFWIEDAERDEQFKWLYAALKAFRSSESVRNDQEGKSSATVGHPRTPLCSNTEPSISFEFCSLGLCCKNFLIRHKARKTFFQY